MSPTPLHPQWSQIITASADRQSTLRPFAPTRTLPELAKLAAEACGDAPQLGLGPLVFCARLALPDERPVYAGVRCAGLRRL